MVDACLSSFELKSSSLFYNDRIVILPDPAVNPCKRLASIRLSSVIKNLSIMISEIFYRSASS